MSGQVEDHLRLLVERHPLDGSRICKVAFDELNVVPVSYKAPGLTARPDGCRDFVASTEQVGDEVGANEAAGARDECSHRALRAIS